MKLNWPFGLREAEYFIGVRLFRNGGIQSDMPSRAQRDIFACRKSDIVR